MSWPVYYVDSFTTTPFRGNHTAVCYLPHAVESSSMQAVAAELNLPVTAYVWKSVERHGAYEIRYFTPVTEIPACGHATLAAAFVMKRINGVGSNTFVTPEKIVIQAVAEDKNIMMAYPRYEWKKAVPPQETLVSLGISSYKAAAYSEELETLFIETETPDILRRIQPDFPRLVKSSSGIIEVVITSASDSASYDYLLRSFCPWIGINEDPVTGSVHSVLAGYWSARLNKELLKACQASPRGGEIVVRYATDHVAIGGPSVFIMKGELEVF